MLSMGTISFCQFCSEGWQEGGNRAFVGRCSTNSHMILAECEEVVQIAILLRYLPGFRLGSLEFFVYISNLI